MASNEHNTYDGGKSKRSVRSIRELLVIGVTAGLTFFAAYAVSQLLFDSGSPASYPSYGWPGARQLKSIGGQAGPSIEQDALGALPSHNVRVPMRNGKVASLESRVRYLERKLSSSLSWLREPRITEEVQYKCKSMVPDLGHHYMVCNDVPISKPCVVYEFGIRTDPSLGLYFAEQHGCEVHGFDPSPITKCWLSDNAAPECKSSYTFNEVEAKNLERVRNTGYALHEYGAGGMDGNLSLYQYNWNQVSILRPVPYLGAVKDAEGAERWQTVYTHSQPLTVPVRTLPSIMKELGHRQLAVLKIDVEGSEWLFLEQMFDEIGCPPVTHSIMLEYHHFSVEGRYGVSPEIQMVMTMLNDCGFYQYVARPWWFGDKEYVGDAPSVADRVMNDGTGKGYTRLRYNFAMFLKVGHQPFEGI